MNKTEILWEMQKGKNSKEIIENILSKVKLGDMTYNIELSIQEIFFLLEKKDIFVKFGIKIPEDENELLDFYLELDEKIKKKIDTIKDGLGSGNPYFYIESQ